MSVKVDFFWNNEELITTETKNKTEQINVIYGERQNKSFIDVRIKKLRKDGLYQFTSKGISIPYENAIEIAKKILAFDKENSLKKENQ